MNSRLALAMPREQLWVGKLSKDQKVAVFCPDEDLDSPIAHSLLVKWVMLGPNAKPEEANILSMETVGGASDDISAPFCGLITSKGKPFDQVFMDVLIPHSKITFSLTEGSGPVAIYAQHISEYQPPEADSDEDELEGLEEEEEDEELESPMLKKRKASNSLELPKKVMKIEQVHEQFTDESSEEESAPEKLQKKKNARGKKVLKADFGARGDAKKK